MSLKKSKVLPVARKRTRPFKAPVGLGDMMKLKTRSYASATECKTRWDYKAFSDWHDTCIETNANCDEDILLSDIWSPATLTKKNL